MATNDFTYTIAGIDFMSAASDKTPLQRGLTQVQKDRVDNSDQPGDQSFTAWWLRSQTDWSAGAGTQFMEPISEDKIQRSFNTSYGVDVWTQGQLSLLKEQAIVGSPISATITVDPQIIRVGTGFYVSAGTTLTYVSATRVFTTCTGIGAGEVITSLATGNGYCYIATNTSVYQISAAATAATKIFDYPDTGLDKRVYFAKDRLIITGGGAIWDEPPPPNVPVLATLAYAGALYRKSGDITWVAAVSTPNSVLLAESGSSGSNIYRLSIVSNASVPQLDTPVSIAEFPPNERVQYLGTYLGAYLAIGTNLGVRIGTIDVVYGSITYGPRIGSPTATGSFVAYDRFLYYPTTDAGQGRTGIVRMDLSEVDATGRPAWANDQRCPAGETGVVTSVALDDDGDLILAVRRAASVAVFESAATYETSGYLRSANIRLGTTEDKYFDSLNVQLAPSWTGTASFSVTDDLDVTTSLGSASFAVDGSDVVKAISPLVASGFISVNITLTAPAGRATSPVVQSWQIKALPSVRRQPLMQLPLLAFDRERDGRGSNFGYDGWALERYEALETASKDGLPFSLVDNSTQRTYSVVLEGLTFEQTAPPEGYSGFGGIVNLTVRAL